MATNINFSPFVSNLFQKTIYVTLEILSKNIHDNQHTQQPICQKSFFYHISAHLLLKHPPRSKIKIKTIIIKK